MNINEREKLTNTQLEILKAFSHQLSQSELLELRKVLAQFFANRLIKEADKVWEEDNWDEELESMRINKVCSSI